jgi:hypothetical protein
VPGFQRVEQDFNGRRLESLQRRRRAGSEHFGAAGSERFGAAGEHFGVPPEYFGTAGSERFRASGKHFGVSSEHFSAAGSERFRVSPQCFDTASPGHFRAAALDVAPELRAAWLQHGRVADPAQLPGDEIEELFGGCEAGTFARQRQRHASAGAVARW